MPVDQREDSGRTARSPKNPLIRRRRKPDRSAVGVCTKYFLFIENFLILLLGLAFTALGTYILVIKDKVVREAYDFLLDPSCLMCLVGAIITFMGFLGSVGALRENTCCLKTYYYTLCIILLGELGAAILVFVAYYVEGVQQKIIPESLFRQAIVNYRDDVDMQNLIDDLQEEFRCCGLSDDDEGFKDWNDNFFFNCTENNPSPESCMVPESCCKKETGDAINHKCGANIYKIIEGKMRVDDTNNINTQGCVKALTDWFKDHALVVGGVLVGVVFPQIIILVLTKNLIEQIMMQRSKW